MLSDSPGLNKLTVGATSIDILISADKVCTMRRKSLKVRKVQVSVENLVASVLT